MEPKKTESLAEFFGILTGDGYIGQYNFPKRTVSSLEISGNRIKDYEYMKDFVLPLIKNLFNVEPHIYIRENQNVLRLIIYSKELIKSINKLGFPLGRKGFITPPSWITENPIFFKKFIRGFFDTDGNLCLKNKEGKKYPVLSLNSKSKFLLIEIQKFLKSYNINSYLGMHTDRNSRYIKEVICYKLQISGRNNVSMFYNLIGSNNDRNVNRYKEIVKAHKSGNLEGIVCNACDQIMDKKDVLIYSTQNSEDRLNLTSSTFSKFV